MKSNVQISWQSQAVIASSSELILSSVNETVDSSSEFVNSRTVTKEVYLKNLGKNVTGAYDSTGYSAGLYIVGEDGPLVSSNSLETLLSWASMLDDDDGLPCGIFSIFGYDDSDASYITKYNDGIITAEELTLFQHNWLQGSNFMNRLELDVARRYLSVDNYKQDSDFESLNSEDTINSFGERSGCLKVLVVIRIPKDQRANRLSFRHSLGYEEKV
jgi:hypothetical protein